jgi:hypothetical protein
MIFDTSQFSHVSLSLSLSRSTNGFSKP